MSRYDNLAEKFFSTFYNLFFLFFCHIYKNLYFTKLGIF